MANAKISLAKRNFSNLLDAVTKNGWKCAHDDNAMKINYGVHGDNGHFDFVISTDVDRQLMVLTSTVNFKINPRKAAEFAKIICAINYALSMCQFDFNVMNGALTFKMPFIFFNSVLSQEAMLFLLNYSIWAIDKYYGKLLAVGNGSLSAETVINEALI